MIHLAICGAAQNQCYTDYRIYLTCRNLDLFIIDSLYDLKARKGHITNMSLVYNRGAQAS